MVRRRWAASFGTADLGEPWGTHEPEEAITGLRDRLGPEGFPSGPPPQGPAVTRSAFGVTLMASAATGRPYQ
jgi:hypothetical protein